MKIKRIFNNKFTYLLIGAFVGFIFNYLLNIKCLEKQDYYASKIERKNFVLELSELMQQRIYNAEVFFWSVRDHNELQTILTSWDRYHDITIKWNEKLINTYLKLDLFFPERNYSIQFMDSKEKITYRDFLASIQDEFISVHGDLIKLIKMTNNNETIDETKSKIIGKKIEKLHVIIANYLQYLADSLKK